MEIIQFPTLVNPAALNTVDELRTALDAANTEIQGLSFRNAMLETSVSHLGNDIADVADAFNASDFDRLMPVLQRISQRVATTRALARAAGDGKAH